MGALLVVLTAALSLLSVATFRRYRNSLFLFLTGGFVAFFAEAIVLSLVALDVVRFRACGFPPLPGPRSWHSF